MGVPPWAPLIAGLLFMPERGAHGGAPIQMFIKISVTNYYLSVGREPKTGGIKFARHTDQPRLAK